MAISKSDQKILNSFPNTQPALQRSVAGLTPANSGVPIGDMLVEATGSGCKSATYRFAVNGGAATTNIVISKNLLPAGAIVSSIIVEVTTALATTGTVAVQLSSETGTSPAAIASITATDLAATGFKNYLSTPVRATAAINSISLNFSNAATAGVLNFYISYVNISQED